MKSHVVIFNRAPLSSSDGWIHIVPKGELPNSEAGIVQVLDDQAFDSILDGITKDKNRLGDKWPGVYAGREHFIYDSDKDSAALAWFKDFEKRADGIWAKDDGLTPAGANAVTNREYKFTSFVSDPKQLQKLEGKRYRITGIETVGFTNQANGKELLTPITNRSLRTATINFADEQSSAANQQKNNQVNKMKNIATKLGLAAEASEDAILAEVTKLLNRGDISPADLVTLRAEHKTRGEVNQTLLTEQVDGILAEHKITDAKIVNRLKPVLTGLKDRADRVGYLTDCGFKAGGEKPAPKRVLNRGTGAQQLEEGSADAAPITPAALNDEVRKVMNRDSSKFEVAFNTLRREKPELFTSPTAAAKE